MTETPESISPSSRPIRDRIHEIIFGAHTFWGVAFDILLLLTIIGSIVVISMETVSGFKAEWDRELFFFKWFFTGLFTLEYLLRIYCVKRPLRYIFSFWGIIDLVSFLPDYLLFWVSGGMASNHFAVVRSLRLLRVFRILNLSWFQNEADDLGNAVWRARGKIIVFLMVVMIIVTVAGTLMYEVENALAPVDQETGISTSQFTSIPTSIYWAIVTMTTVGFGDIVPVTSVGKIISAVLILFGYSLIIVPTGFVSAEVLRGRKDKSLSNISCKSCLTQGHESDANYCKFCGEKL